MSRRQRTPAELAARQNEGVRTYFHLLRAGAAQLVLFGHAITIGVPWTRGTNLYYIQAFGVVLLIMISGYLIAGSVRRRVQEGSFSFWSFMRDRFVRIFLPLLPVIPAVLLFDWLMLPPGGTAWTKADHSLQSITFTSLMLADNSFFQFLDQNLGTHLFVRAVGSDAPLWAVALEWWLYVGFAGIVALALAWRRCRWRIVVIVLTVFAVLTVSYSMVFGNWRPLGWLITAGCGWFALRLDRLPIWVWRALVVAGIGTVIIGMTAFERGVYLPLTAIGSGVTIVAILRGIPLGWLATFARPIAFIAGYGYSLFLVHYPIIIYMNAHGFHVGWRFLIFAVLVAHGIAIAWWALFERHSATARQFASRIWPSVVALLTPKGAGADQTTSTRTSTPSPARG